MPGERTHYDILRITRDADADGIRAAYRARVKNLHPDRYEGEPPAEDVEEMHRVNLAHEVLSDPEKRAAYDRSIRPEPRPVSESRERTAPQQDTREEVVDVVDDDVVDLQDQSEEDAEPTATTWTDFWDYTPTRRIIVAAITGSMIFLSAAGTLVMQSQFHRVALISAIALAVVGAIVIVRWTAPTGLKFAAPVLAAAPVVLAWVTPDVSADVRILTTVFASLAIAAVPLGRWGVTGVIELQRQISESRREVARYRRTIAEGERRQRHSEKARQRAQARHDRRHRRE